MSNSTPTASAKLFQRWPWLPLVLPMAVFMVGTEAENRLVATASPVVAAATEPLDNPQGERSQYPLLYSVKIAVTAAALAWCWPAYRQFTRSVSPWSVAVGIFGVVLWIALCRQQLEARWLPTLGLGWLVGEGTRIGFNPLAELAAQPAWAYGFLAIRFFGLALVVPLIEEVFLRGFLMRFVTRNDWWNVGWREIRTLGLVLGTLVPMAMHPAEMLAAAVWFSLISALMLYTRSLWDCIVAHAVTNLLLGVYVVTTGHWELM